ncbi:MAG: hypothetical protein ACFFD2_10505 [Promethearchaeota archaeon]
MVSVEFEKEFNLTTKQAYDTIVLWLVAIKAKIKDHNEPYYIKAVHGVNWKQIEDFRKKKTIMINIIPPEHGKLGIKVHVKASLSFWHRKKRMEIVKEYWDKYLFSQLWTVLNETKQEAILWQIKVIQFLVTLPKVKKDSDFKNFMKKLCERFRAENLTDEQVQQITEALKLQLLTAKIFNSSKKEKILELVGNISKNIFGKNVPVVISGALLSLVEHVIKNQ